MKKTYIAPASAVYALTLEGMVATSSITIGDTAGDQMMSDKGGWNASDWSGTEDVVEE